MNLIINYLKFLRFLTMLRVSWGTEGWRVHHKKLAETDCGPTFSEAIRNLLIKLREYKQMLEEREPRLSDALQSELDYLRKLLDNADEHRAI